MTVRKARGRTIGAAVEGLRRDAQILTEELVADLDSTMAATFGAAQAMVPVELGSLRNSGRSGSDVRDRGETWIGWMAWGAESAPRDVDYAVYRMAEGGEGDWLRESHVYEQVFDAVIRSNVARRLARASASCVRAWTAASRVSRRDARHTAPTTRDRGRAPTPVATTPHGEG